MVDPRDAVSPLDGRYAERTAPLRPYVSEGALARARVRVEVEYLIALADLTETPFTIDDPARSRLRDRYREWGSADADRVKAYEVEGVEGRGPTHHDVKAVEYYVREHAPESARPWVHFGLTSEDINNLARRLLLRQAVREVLLPAAREARDELTELAAAGRSIPMPGRTHGQFASPTTFGKEMAVFATRLGRALGDVHAAVTSLTGKLAGATGTYAAHVVAFPDVDWRAFAEEFVTDLGFEHVDPVTQVHPGDDLAKLFHAWHRVNGVLLDCTRDVWQYIGDGFLVPTDVEGVGSSTMPHKVNPIDFENAEGNLATANNDLGFLAEYLQTSRLQRDLSDSTVKRTIGPTLAHCLLAYDRITDGLRTVEPDEEAMAAALTDRGEVLTEAIQTILRREGHSDAYERIAAATQGRSVTVDELRSLIDDLDVSDATKTELRSITPRDYIGVAPALADLVTDDE